MISNRMLSQDLYDFDHKIYIQFRLAELFYPDPQRMGWGLGGNQATSKEKEKRVSGAVVQYYTNRNATSKEKESNVQGVKQWCGIP